MRKKLIGFLLILLLVFLGPKSFATGSDIKVKNTSENTIENSKYGITNPEKRSFSLEKKVSLINGYAPEGTIVKIKHFATVDLTGKKYNLLNLPVEDEYVEIDEQEIKVGKLGVFDTKLNLIDGINLLRVNFGVADMEDVEIIIYVSSFQNMEKIVLK